jgi:phosphatidylglycerol:prolipoprotein diacylglycerol transferase
MPVLMLMVMRVIVSMMTVAVVIVMRMDFVVMMVVIVVMVPVIAVVVAHGRMLLLAIDPGVLPVLASLPGKEGECMIPYPEIDPELFAIGPIKIRWYGLMYVLGFIGAYLLIPRQRRSREIGLQGTVAQDLIFYLAIGLIVGARLGYVIFYQFNNYSHYIQNPLEIVATWHGGMSFHGGFLGAVLAGWLFSRRRKMPFWAIADSAAVTAPIGLGLGRVGNFINGELFGRPSDVPWAMVFPEGGPLPRHPSQLYEAALEGLVLFILLWFLRQRSFRDGMMVVLFVFFYGVFRFVIEFYREPDPQIGLLLGFFTMGQMLCLAMVLGAALLALLLPGTAGDPGTPKRPASRRSQATAISRDRTENIKPRPTSSDNGNL